MQFSLIVLSNTTSEAIVSMNLECFNSFIASAKLVQVDYEIILVESNKKSKYEYPVEQLKIVTPDASFNFHKFLNIGIQNATADYYILSNNDVVYDVNWLKELLKVRDLNPEIDSFSPYDVLANKTPKETIETQDYILGYKIQRHLTGWCLVVSNKAINTIKKLDERFSFYYTDNDYAMSLIKYNFKHALVTKSIAHHLESVSSKNIREKKPFKLNPKTPKYIISENWTWVLENEKMIEDLITFHNKWGSRKVVKLKLLIAKQFSKLGLGYFNRFILVSR